ncbi:MAG: hypothetical protein QW625_01540 [Candidatus Nanoarchaeia archaeon]
MIKKLIEYPLFKQIFMRHHGLEAGPPLEHHLELKKMLKIFNNFLIKDFSKLEKIFESIIRENRPIEENVNIISQRIIIEIFGPEGYKQEKEDYVRFIGLLTSGTGVEKILRKYYFGIIQHKFKIDPKTGKTNLLELEKEIIKFTDSFMVKLMKMKNVRDVDFIELFIFDDLDGDPMRFIRLLLFFVINILTIYIVMKLLRSKAVFRRAVALISKIFYGISLSDEQFKLLEKYNLVGGIIFRGLRITTSSEVKVGEAAEQALKLLKGSGPVGGSWTIDRNVAALFTRGLKAILDRKAGYLLNSLEEFKQILKRKLKWPGFEGEFLIDDPNVAYDIISYIKDFSRINKNKWDVSFALGILFSYPITDQKMLLYVGSKLFGKFQRYAGEKEVIVNPKYFVRSKFSVDVALLLRVEPKLQF